ncbi:UPF0164 family protein [Candidatus Poribacteria bacterium]|nr:UPF0164 family protein [Candidatus Poribacteria bacterium]
MIQKRIYVSLVFISIIFVSYSAQLWATNEGAGDAWPSLRIGVGARAVGMGGAFVALADDATAIRWNPSGLGFIKKVEGTFMHIGEAALPVSDPTAQGITRRYEYLSGVMPTRLGCFGFSSNYFNIGGIQYTIGTSELDFQRISGFDQQATERIFTLAYGYPIQKEWVLISMGGSIRRMRQQFLGVSTDGWGYDVGFIVKKENLRRLKNPRLGYVFRWQSSRTWKDRPDIEAPEQEDGYIGWNCGVAFDPIVREKLSWTMAFNLVNQRKGSPLTLSAGAEVWLLNNRLALRVGIDDWCFHQRDASQVVWEETKFRGRLTTGMGLCVSIARIDYAIDFAPLAPKHRVSITLGRLR